MKYLILFLFLLTPLAALAQEVPRTLAGITLGADITTVQSHCRLTTDLILPEERHLNEIMLQPGFVPGIKAGTVAYGNCAQKGKIIRIKLKFIDSSRSFFNELLRRYKLAFGSPQEWRGDPFQKVISWKWSFEEKAGQRVGLELTHSKDPDYKTGNFVKFTLRSLWDEEAACRERKWQQQDAFHPMTTSKKLDYSLFIPH